MFRYFHFGLRVAVLCAAPFALLGTYSETVLYKFGRPPDAAAPSSGLTADASGSLYGVTSGGGSAGKGAVYKLTPSGASYKESVIYSFKGGLDGEFPSGTLLVNSRGAVIGTSQAGGGSSACGTVFKLLPSGGSYRYSTLFTFDCYSTGGTPTAGVIVDAAQALYGTTSEGGTQRGGVVFKLTPKGGIYTETILHNFGSADDGGGPNQLLLGAGGVLYGTTSGGGDFNYGIAYELVPLGSGKYQESILHTFGGPDDGQSPQSALIMDAQGTLYGTTAFGGSATFGTAFALMPSGSSYTEDILYNFPGGGGFPTEPAGALLPVGSAKFDGLSEYGGSANQGTAYQLYPVHKGYHIRSLWQFDGGSGGGHPYGTPIADGKGALYGVGLSDSPLNNGFVFKLTP